MAFTCGEEVEFPNDRLNDIGILGTWEISDESINGVSDLTVKCCKFIEFVPDDSKEDFRGRFTYRDGAVMSKGFFTVYPDEETIVFVFDGERETEYQYEFNVPMDSVTFTFSEDDSDFVQNWDKVD